VFAHLLEAGSGSVLEGVYACIDDGWFQREIADAAFDFERKLNADRNVIVGVNAFTDGNDEPLPETLQIGPDVEEAQCKRLAAVRADRDGDRVAGALERVRNDAADPEVNLMPALLESAESYASIGEIVEALAVEFGRYREDPVI